MKTIKNLSTIIVAVAILFAFVPGLKNFFKSLAYKVCDEIATDDGGYLRGFRDKLNWTNCQVVATQAPIYKMVGEQGWLQRGEFKPMSKVEAGVTEGHGFLFGSFEPERDEKGNVQYWDIARPILVNFRVHPYDSYQPMAYVECAQRRSDGRGYKFGWALFEDVQPVKQPDLPLAPWGRVALRNRVENDGKREIIDRYSVILSRGQKSCPLTYVAPPWELGEQGKFDRRWRIRTASKCTLIMIVNGHRFIVPPESFTDLNEVKLDGTVIVQIELGRDAEQEQAPVEFVYYREKV
ncbi:MAG: hypothetical protein AABZ06_09100 [Bdellovibrionota bacterium]